MAKRRLDSGSALVPFWLFWLPAPSLHGLAEASWQLIVILVVAVGVFATVVLIGIYHWHEITETALVIHAGPFGLKVPLASIFDVAPTRDGVPASQNAIRIRYYKTGIVGDSVVVFPQDRSEFLASLARRCPQLAAFGEGLKRAPSTTPAA